MKFALPHSQAHSLGMSCGYPTMVPLHIGMHCKPLLQQMGRIRAAEAAARRRRAVGVRYRRSGGVGYVELEADEVIVGCHFANRGAN